jgi:hypothetical protein
MKIGSFFEDVGIKVPLSGGSNLPSGIITPVVRVNVSAMWRMFFCDGRMFQPCGGSFSELAGSFVPGGEYFFW